MPRQGPMEAPVCLITNDDRGKLAIMPDALEILDRIDQPVVVVTIVGLYRTGKSYLMNQLAGKKKGFTLGITRIQPHTKGIWMWCLPHPTKPGHTLVLLDTEGLGDAEKGDSNNDSVIFALAILLSSVLVYNGMGTINPQALELLHFVTELADHIKLGGKENKQDEDEDDDEEGFARVFPAFVWVVRDFILQLEIDGKDVTESEYLEHMLTLKKGIGKRVLEYNLPRECIQRFFPTRNCFVFVRPASKDQISKLESLPEHALDPKFVAQMRKFHDYVFEKAEVKKVKGGHELNGRKFGILVNNYVTTIVNGGAPCIENAVLSMAKSENEAAMLDAEEHYKTQMEKLVKLPAAVQELSDAHGKCVREALDIFMKRSFKDKDHHYQGMLKNRLEGFYAAMVVKNENTSLERCRSLIKDLFTTLEKNVTSGVYFRPDGYKTYICDRDKVVKQFQEIPNKGVKAQLVLEEFLSSKKGESETILQADANLTEAQKKVAEEKAKAAQLEQERKAAEERALQKEQLLKDQERSHQENLVRLKAKMREDAAKQKMEAEKALQAEQLLKDQMRSHQEHMAQLQRKMEEETENTKKAAEKKAFQAEQLMKDRERSHQEYVAQLQRKVEEAENIKKEAEKKASQAAQLLEERMRSHQEHMAQLQRKMEEETENTKKALEKKASQAAQLLEDRERSHQENIEKLTTKMREEAQKERTLEGRMKLQEDLIRQGFEDQARRMESEIESLKKEVQQALRRPGLCELIRRALSYVFGF
ncbi:guanylate-binding protein 1-like isoform X1 [Lissotriton helveticus]